jgi:hypothetical protein
MTKPRKQNSENKRVVGGKNSLQDKVEDDEVNSTKKTTRSAIQGAREQQ